jgi:hypothetical protein
LVLKYFEVPAAGIYKHNLALSRSFQLLSAICQNSQGFAIDQDSVPLKESFLPAYSSPYITLSIKMAVKPTKKGTVDHCRKAVIFSLV